MANALIGNSNGVPLFCLNSTYRLKGSQLDSDVVDWELGGGGRPIFP